MSQYFIRWQTGNALTSHAHCALKIAFSDSICSLCHQLQCSLLNTTFIFISGNDQPGRMVEGQTFTIGKCLEILHTDDTCLFSFSFC